VHKLFSYFSRPYDKEWIEIDHILGKGALSLHCSLTLSLCKDTNKVIETKWGIIKHDVTKFCGNYNVMNALCELGTSNENILPKY